MSASGVYMSHSESFKYQIINKYLCGSLYRDEAAQLLNFSLRTVSRYAKKIKYQGVFGVKHVNCGKKTNQKYKDELRRQVNYPERTFTANGWFTS
ncbi:MAG: hypothetical protein KDD58_13040 [Bdellovibrionales bacterium]|nr:hypothetical protein [Bdellovibrionales bacterium]